MRSAEREPSSPYHPDLQRAARMLPRGLPLLPWSLPALRWLTSHRRRAAPAAAIVDVVGSVPVRIHRPPPGQSGGALLWIHGGGYVLGSPQQDDDLCRRFSDELGITVVAPAYRLAPEHAFPAPLEDCYQVLEWLADLPHVDRDRIAVGGGSAGAGLAAAVALAARERGNIALAFQLLAYPMLDDRTALRNDLDERHFRGWNNRSNEFGWRSYLGVPPGHEDVSSLAAPARAEDLSGLPPAWIGVGTHDLFFDEIHIYVERLRAAGVPCELRVIPGAFHGFDSVAPAAQISRSFNAAQIAALAAALGTSCVR